MVRDSPGTVIRRKLTAMVKEVGHVRDPVIAHGTA